jgi:hypothetical protein
MLITTCKKKQKDCILHFEIIITNETLKQDREEAENFTRSDRVLVLAT